MIKIKVIGQWCIKIEKEFYWENKLDLGFGITCGKIYKHIELFKYFKFYNYIH